MKEIYYIVFSSSGSSNCLECGTTWNASSPLWCELPTTATPAPPRAFNSGQNFSNPWWISSTFSASRTWARPTINRWSTRKKARWCFASSTTSARPSHWSRSASNGFRCPRPSGGCPSAVALQSPRFRLWTRCVWASGSKFSSTKSTRSPSPEDCTCVTFRYLKQLCYLYKSHQIL